MIAYLSHERLARLLDIARLSGYPHEERPDCTCRWCDAVRAAERAVALSGYASAGVAVACGAMVVVGVAIMALAVWSAVTGGVL